MNGDFLSTNELRKHVRREYKKLRKKAILSLVYRPLSTKFEICSSNSLDGEYCYSDEKGYYYCALERGSYNEKIITEDLFEVTYLAIGTDIFSMASLYESMHRKRGKDPRRILFAKELELFSEIGEKYCERHRKRIEKYLKMAPYEDE